MSLTDRLNKGSMVRRCSIKLYKREFLTSGPTGQTTCGQSTLNMVNDYTIEDSGFRVRSLSSKVPYVSNYQPCNLSWLRTKSTSGSHKQASYQNILSKAIHSDQILKSQDKTRASSSNWLIAPSPKKGHSNTPQSSVLYTVKKKEFLRRNILNHRTPLNMTTQIASVNAGQRQRVYFPRSQLL